MVKDLAREQFKVVVITDLHIANQPNKGYAPYDSGTAGDHFVKNPDGSTFVGKVWPGPAVFPDFTQAQTRQWWGTLYKTFVDEGVAGFWNDMNEPAVFETPTKTMPDDIQHRIDEPGFRKRTAPHLEIHNVYGMENARGTYEGLLALRPDERPFVMSRASFAGGQRYSTTWTGDNSSTWNHLRMTVPQIVNLGLSGFSFTGADVGGFAGSPPPDLLTKWIELSAFQPIDRDHSAKGTRMHEVWVDGPEQEAIRRRYIEERYRLMPYLYTVAEETSHDGLPINRPLFLEFPHAIEDGTPFDLTTGGAEFLVGSRVLVAPNPSPEEVAPYVVRLPPGTWYDYWTGERYVRAVPGTSLDAEQRDLVLAEKQLSVTPKLDQMPVYVRGGTILPIAPLTQSTAEVPQRSADPACLSIGWRLEACSRRLRWRSVQRRWRELRFPPGCVCAHPLHLRRGIRWLGERDYRKPGRFLETLVAFLPDRSGRMDAQAEAGCCGWQECSSRGGGRTVGSYRRCQCKAGRAALRPGNSQDHGG